MNPIDVARDSLGNFCMNVCKAQCCQRGRLLLEKREADAIDPTLVADERQYVTVDLSKGCPKLVNNACSIYTSRPKTCRQYPIYDKGKLLLVASDCQGVKEGQLAEHLQTLREAGYRIEFI